MMQTPNSLAYTTAKIIRLDRFKMADGRKEASRLRKSLHFACHECDINALRRALHCLYESNDSPLGSKEAVATPMAFAAMIEVGLLSRCLSTLQPCRVDRAEMATEMEDNVKVLEKAFGIDRVTSIASKKAFARMYDEKTVSGAQEASDLIFENTQLCGRIKLTRHVGRKSDL